MDQHKKHKGEEEMRRSYLAVVPALALLMAVITGCGGKPMTQADIEKNLVGKWKADTEQLKASMKAEMKRQAENAPDNSAAMAAMIDGIIAQLEMTFEFKNNGKVSMTQSVGGKDQTQENDWKITRVDNGKATVNFGGEAAGYVTFVDKDVIEFTPLDEGENDMPSEMEPFRMNRMK